MSIGMDGPEYCRAGGPMVESNDAPSIREARTGKGQKEKYPSRHSVFQLGHSPLV